MSAEYPCIYFEKSGVCRKFSSDIDFQYCVMGPCPEQKISNADRIRSMSDEELVDWAINKVPQIASRYSDSKLGLLDWLQQPAKDGT